MCYLIKITFSGYNLNWNLYSIINSALRSVNSRFFSHQPATATRSSNPPKDARTRPPSISGASFNPPQARCANVSNDQLEWLELARESLRDEVGPVSSARTRHAFNYIPVINRVGCGPPLHDLSDRNASAFFCVLI